MKIKREERYQVDFPVFLTLQAGSVSRRINARCIGLSRSGAMLETLDRLEKGAMVLVMSEQFGRMGLASVRYCTRTAIKYRIGLNFGTGLLLNDPSRREMLEKVLRRPASDAQGPVLPQ
jgi:hypothetical protein